MDTQTQPKHHNNNGHVLAEFREQLKTDPKKRDAFIRAIRLGRQRGKKLAMPEELVVTLRIERGTTYIKGTSRTIRIQQLPPTLSTVDAFSNFLRKSLQDLRRTQTRRKNNKAALILNFGLI